MNMNFVWIMSMIWLMNMINMLGLCHDGRLRCLWYIWCWCLIDAIVLWYACYSWIYILLDEWWGFYAMDECETFVMFGCEMHVSMCEFRITY